MVTNEHIRGVKIWLNIPREQAEAYLASEPDEEEIKGFIARYPAKKYDRNTAARKLKWLRLAKAIIIYRSHYNIPARI